MEAAVEAELSIWPAEFNYLAGLKLFRKLLSFDRATKETKNYLMFHVLECSEFGSVFHQISSFLLFGQFATSAH